MKDKLLKFILVKNYAGVLTWGVDLSDKERYEAIDTLMSIDLDEELKHLVNPDPYNRTNEERGIYSLHESLSDFIALCCMRSVEDVYLTEDYKGSEERSIHFCKATYYLTRQSFDNVHFEKYLTLYCPTYIADIVKSMMTGGSFVFFNKYVLWLLNHKGYIEIEEEAMVLFFYDIPMFYYDTNDMANFFIEKEEAIDDVLLLFYKYDVSVLDRSKWNSTKDGYVCAVVTTFWDEVFQELLAKGKLTDRSIIANLLGSLTNSWKKGRLDWHVRLIKMFKPTKAEYLAHQELLFSALSSSSASVRNYAVGEIVKLYKEKGFDKELFLQSATFLFMQDKQDKALLSVIEIADYVVSSDTSLSTYIPDYSTLLLQPNEDVQTKTAKLLTKYLECDELNTLVTPYTSTIRQQTLEILGADKVVEEMITVLPIEHIEVGLPQTWEDFLFHVGKTIESEAVLDIDVLYESAITHLKNLTKEQIKQLAPHINRASKKNSVLSDYIYELLYNCANHSTVFSELVTMRILTDYKKHYKDYVIEKVENGFSLVHTNEIPLLRAKNVLLWKGVISAFLSTPTHTPFYVDPFMLVTKLIQYEEQGIEVVLDDLIVACNRVLKEKIIIAAQDLAKQLKGEYREAILYLLGVTDEIVLQAEYLPLWTQVARTKHPDRVFKEFEDTWCKDLPTVVSPLLYDYELVQHTSWRAEDEFYYQLELVGYSEIEAKKEDFSKIVQYYYTYPIVDRIRDIGYKSKSRLYSMSLVPHYPNLWLIDVLLTQLTYTESEDLNYATVPLQFLIEHQIMVKHNGWLYICLCLLFDKKTPRQLAREYLQLAFGLGFIDTESIANYLTTMLLNNLAPINRFIEYMDEATSIQERELQYAVITSSITRVEKGKLPTNFKKMVGYYDEIGNELGQAAQEQIALKRKELKL